VSAGGDVVVYATDNTDVDTISGALAGGLVGIGGSVGVLTIHKVTEANGVPLSDSSKKASRGR